MTNATPVPVLSDNYVWVLADGDSGSAVVVDPGEHQPVLTFLDQSGLECSAIFLTHHHGDHVGGMGRIRETSGCPVYGPISESIPGVTNPVDEGDTVTAAGLDFEVLAVPGHTRGHVAYFGHGQVFCGDTLFAGGCGRIFEGTAFEMFTSVSRLGFLEPSTRVCCAHEYTVANLRFALDVEPNNQRLADRFAWAQRARAENRPTLPSRIEDELATNPFLRCDQPEVVDSASGRAGRPLEPGHEVFAEIRSWKDNFR